MKNKTVKLILGIVLLAVLTGGYFGVKSYVAIHEETESEQEEEKTSVFATDTNEIKTLKFIIDQKEVTFIKEDETWHIKDEKEFPVNQEKLTDAVSKLSSFTADRVLQDVENLGEYGLDNPQNTITISCGEKETTLRVGIKNDSTSQYYINKNEDKDTVYVVEETLITPFMNTLYDYAQMQTFPTVDASQIKKIIVNQKEKSYQAIKNSNTGIWQLEGGVEPEKADTTKINSITSSITSFEYDTFADYNCTDKAKYGLENPYAILTVDYEGAKEETTTTSEDSEASSGNNEPENVEPEMIKKQLTLLIGSETDSNSRYVMIDGSKEVYTITKDLLSTVIDKDISTMLDLTVYYLPLTELKSLDAELNEQKTTINVSRETIEVEDKNENESETSDSNPENASTDTEPKTETIVKYTMDGKELDGLKFSKFYNKLINLTGQKRLTEEYHPENTPEMKIVFHNLNNKRVNVDFYEYDVNYFAAVVDNKVYLINKMTYREMKESYEQLLSEESEE